TRTRRTPPARWRSRSTIPSSASTWSTRKARSSDDLPVNAIAFAPANRHPRMLYRGSRARRKAGFLLPAPLSCPRGSGFSRELSPGGGAKIKSSRLKPLPHGQSGKPRAAGSRLHSPSRRRGHCMLPGWILLLVSVAYAALLFVVAWWGDRHPQYAQKRAWLRPLVYSLSLAVYCSSWTFYGAVGTATRTGIGYFPIYLGPLLVLLFGWRILERLALIAQSQGTVSIADFIAARFGRSQALAAMVSVIALIAAVPYL